VPRPWTKAAETTGIVPGAGRRSNTNGSAKLPWRKTKKCAGVLNINVGVDVHNYRPTTDDEMLGIHMKARPK